MKGITCQGMKRYMRSMFFSCVLGLMLLPGLMMAQQALTLKEITNGTFRAERLAAVVPSADGEHYTQISDDGRRIEQYSFKTGQLTGTLLDLATARGAKFERIDDYMMSPDGTRMLIQTETDYVYRRSFKAVFYIFDIRSNKLEAGAALLARRTAHRLRQGQ